MVDNVGGLPTPLKNMSHLGLLLENPPNFKFCISVAMFNSFVKLPEGNDS